MSEVRPPRGSRRVFGSPRDRGLLIGTAVAVLVLLVGAGVYVAVRGGGSPTPRASAPTSGAPGHGPAPSGSSGSATTPGQSVFGVSIPLGTPATEARIVDGIRQRYGSIPVARVYSATPPPQHWSDDPTLAALGTGSRVVYSFKGDAVAAASGAYDKQVTDFLSSRPAGLKVWVAYYHEPEDQVADGTFTAQQYRDATAHLAPVIRAAGGIPTTILMAYTLAPASGRHWQDYYSPAVDVLAWDVYNTGVKRKVPFYKPAAAIMAPILEVQKQTGKPFGVGEWGSPCIPSDPDCSGRAAWVQDMAAALSQDGAVFATYFNQNGVKGGPDYMLGDAPSTKVFRGLVGE